MPLCPKCHFQWTSTERSPKQNRAYFGLAVELLAKQCNCNVDTMHKALAGEFLGYDTIIMPNGRMNRVPRSTKTLTTVEFMNYVEKIQRYASENGLEIPNPGESNG